MVFIEMNFVSKHADIVYGHGKFNLDQTMDQNSVIFERTCSSSRRCLVKFTDEKGQRPSKDQIMAE